MKAAKQLPFHLKRISLPANRRVMKWAAPAIYHMETDALVKDGSKGRRLAVMWRTGEGEI